MKNNPTLLHTALTLALCTTANNSHALDFSNDILSFDGGINTCLYGGTYPACNYYGATVSGSYFAMDFNGDGQFTNNERTPISPGPMGGIVLGQLQPASGSHSGCPNGTEVPGPDMPWCFFGNTGMHQVTASPVINNGNGTLDFSGWGVTWNSISNIPLGGDSANFPADTGLAEISCSNNPCQPGDVTNVDYFTHIPMGDPSGFGGVYYTLHLANVGLGPVATVSLAVTNGTTQECNSTGGNSISVQASYTLPADDSLNTINWRVDGVAVGNGDSLQTFLSLGSHSIEAEITTVNGVVGRKSTNVLIQDTTAPQVTAAFVDRRRGSAISRVRHMNLVKIQAEATDICDPVPTVNAMIGAPAENNRLIRANSARGSVQLDVPSLTLSVNAADASGNGASSEAVLTITQ